MKARGKKPAAAAAAVCLALLLVAVCLWRSGRGSPEVLRRVEAGQVVQAALFPLHVDRPETVLTGEETLELVGYLKRMGRMEKTDREAARWDGGMGTFRVAFLDGTDFTFGTDGRCFSFDGVWYMPADAGLCEEIGEFTRRLTEKYYGWLSQYGKPAVIRRVEAGQVAQAALIPPRGDQPETVMTEEETLELVGYLERIDHTEKTDQRATQWDGGRGEIFRVTFLDGTDFTFGASPAFYSINHALYMPGNPGLSEELEAFVQRLTLKYYGVPG